MFQSPKFQRHLTSDQVTALYSQAIKMAIGNKINAQNSWNLNLIDHIDRVLEDEKDVNDEGLTNFQKASSTLDAGARIYACRVDSLTTDTFKVLGGLTRTRQKDGESGKEKDNDGDGDDADDESGMKQRKARKKAWHVSETVVQDTKSIDESKFDAFVVDPLFRQTTQRFDSGGVKGLLLDHLLPKGLFGLTLDSDKSEEENSSPPQVEDEEQQKQQQSTQPIQSDGEEDSMEEEMLPKEIIEEEVEDEESETILDPNAGNSILKAMSASLPIGSAESFESLSMNSLFEPLQNEYYSLLGIASNGDNENIPFAIEGGADDYLDDDFDENDIDAQEMLIAREALQTAQNVSYSLITDENNDDENFTDQGGILSTTTSTTTSLPAPQAPIVVVSEASMGSETPREGRERFKGLTVLPHAPELLKYAGFRFQSKKATTTTTTSTSGSTSGSSRKKKSKETPYIDFSNWRSLVDPSMLKPSPRSANVLTQATLDKRSEGKTTLPSDIHYQASSLVKLFLRPSYRHTKYRAVIPGSDESGNIVRGGGGNGLFDEEMGRDESGDESGDDHDDGGGMLDMSIVDDMEMPLGGDELEDGGENSPSSTVIGGYQLLDDPSGRNASAGAPVGYARVAKRVDVGLLKKNIWNSMEKIGIVDDEDNIDKKKSSEGGNASVLNTFSSTLSSLSTLITPKDKQNLSIPLCFVCLLHLANEKKLKIENHDGNLGELFVEQERDDEDNDEE